MPRRATRLITAAALSFAATVSTQGRAATVWLGPDISFAKADFADPTQAANQDRITNDVWITRGDTGGIYNVKTEATYSALSPADTEWAWDLAGFNTGLSIAATNFANLTFSPWVTALGSNPPSTVGLPGVLHLISNDIYINIEFTAWSVGQLGGGGGFSYIRSTLPEPSSAMLAALAALLLPAVRRPSHG